MELQTSVDVNSTGANLSATNGVCESASSSEQSGQAEDSLSSANLCQQPETSNSHPANPFHVDTSKIATVPANEQDVALQELGLTVYNQDEFELGVMAQVDQAMAEEEKERLRKMLTKQLTSVEDDLRTCKQDLKHVDKVLSMIPSQGGAASKESQRKMEAVKRQRENKLKQLRKLRAKQKSLKMKLDGNTDGLDEDDAEDGGSSMLEEALGLGTSSKETDQERMVRLGEMTPFGSVVNFQDGSSTSQSNTVPPSPARSTISQVSDFEKFLMDKDISAIQKGKRKKSGHENDGRKKIKAVQAEPIMSPLHDGSSEWSPKKKIKDQNYKFKRKGTNYFDSKDKRVYRPAELDFSQPRFERYRKTRYPKFKHNFSEDSALDFSVEGDDDDYIPDERELRHTWLYEDDIDEGRKKPKKMGRGAKGQVSSVPEYHSDDEDVASSLNAIKSQYLPRKKASRDLPISKSRDDGNEKCYLARIRELKLAKLKKKHKDVLEDGDSGSSSSEDSDTEQSMEFDGGFIVPGKIWKKLYRYQKTGVKWLWELHGQQAGGIVGDEMGLGKTIQIIAFLTGLKISQLRDKGSKYRGLGPVLIVCPTTVMHQWVREFHTWWPLHRVAILHSTGSYSGSEKNWFSEYQFASFEVHGQRKTIKSFLKVMNGHVYLKKNLIHNIVKAHSILVTSYSHVVIHQDTLLEYDWHYVILDEGHKIRNPDAQITIACKQFRTCHRLILSGSPVQNNLKELWSLLDFVFPGKLGTLPDFMQHFSVPIVQGGYSNASDVQVQTAYKCACVLRDTINPYLLRRMKADVKNNLNLPQKSEQVLFCRLTEEQRDVYQEYLDSKECNMILAGNYMVFPGLITLRKVCNHPDLCTGGPKEYLSCQPVETTEASEYGYWKRSGKMIVISSLLKLWKKQGQRVLLFTQSRQMMTILETFVEQQGYTFLRMDGSTPISARQSLINQFNNDTSYFLFLLTTRVGGLGVNLTGANRVVIFDPDWNPSTDTQARERAWRIGQKRNVTVYRLVTTGTIEEKIYHRQIFKQFLTNRVLKDPKQRRFFKSNDLYELFTLGDDDKQNSTETSAIFAGTGSDVRVQPRPVGKHDPGKKNYFDEMKEKAQAEKDKFIDDDEVDEFEEERNKDTEGEIEAEKESDSGIKTDEEKRMKMRKLAKMLSQKLVQTDNYGTKPETGQTDVLNTISDRAMSSDRLHGTSTCTTTSTTASHEKTDDCSFSTGKLNSQKTKATDSVEKSKGKKAAKDSKHEKHKHKKKRKKKKDAEFEGEKIAHLDKHQAYKQANEEEESKKSAEQDDYVLQRLFKKSGVHSAMQHDTIMQSSDPDYALVEAEADRVAREAARALKTSRARCLGASSGVPTWTGQRGGSGAPGAKPRFGAKKNSRLLTEPGSKPVTAQVTAIKSKEVAKAPVPTRHFDGSVAGTSKSTGLTSSIPNVMSSKELLARMRSRNNVAIGQSEDGEDGAVSMGANQEVDELMTEIRNFVAFQGTIDGQASTTELLDAFGSKLPASDSARFKAMLQQICNFVRQGGVGIWRLKPEFK